MQNTFKEYLLNNGIPNSRHHSIYRAMESLHIALCGLDSNNQNTILNDIGILELCNIYAKSEHLKTINLWSDL